MDLHHILGGKSFSLLGLEVHQSLVDFIVSWWTVTSVSTGFITFSIKWGSGLLSCCSNVFIGTYKISYGKESSVSWPTIILWPCDVIQPNIRRGALFLQHCPLLDSEWILLWENTHTLSFWMNFMGLKIIWTSRSSKVWFKSHNVACATWSTRVLTCRVRVGRITHLLVRVEFWLGGNQRGEFLGCLLLGDGDACTAQRWGRLHPGRYLSGLVGTVSWVPHGSVEKEPLDYCV